METKVKIVVEEHPDGFVAHARGVEGVVVGQGETYEEALADVRSAIQFHQAQFGKEAVVTPKEPEPEEEIGEVPVMDL